MKICHFSDSHLGAGENHHRRGLRGLTLRQEDIINCFIDAIDKIIAIRPDICVHSGDLFHSVRPLNRIMAIAAEQLHRLAVEQQIPTIVIIGNHDAPRQPHIGAAVEVFRQIDNLNIATGSELRTFEIGGCRILALPHCLTTAVQNELLADCVPDSAAEYNILVAHGVAAGMPEFSMADLGEQELPLEMLERFDYVALGHYHNYCQVAPRIWYAGSTERLSQSERNFAKGFIEVELDPFHVRFHEVASRKMVDIQTINAAGKRGDQLLEIIQKKLKSVDTSDKIVRMRIDDVSPEAMKTLPAEAVAELREQSYALDIRFQKQKDDDSDQVFGRSAIGRLDEAFCQYLEVVNLDGFDRERLKRVALNYLASEDK